MAIRVKNIAAGYYAGGVFHPIRASEDYDPSKVGEDEKYKSARLKKAAAKRARQAARIAKESRALRRAAARAEKAVSSAKAKRKAAAALLAATGKGKRKKNPIPLNRYVDAKIKRTRSGDIKVIIPLR